MPGRSWSISVSDAIQRYISRTGTAIFTSEALIDSELRTVLADTQSLSTNARRMMSRELQRLCSVGVLELTSRGSYRYCEFAQPALLLGSKKGVFGLSLESATLDNPAEFYRFSAADLPIVARLIGSAILYQLGKHRYYAAAKIESISPDPTNAAEYLAWIEPGSLLEFGQHVPLQIGGRMFERGLQHPNGRIDNARASQRVRLIDDDDFFRVLDHTELEAAIGPTRDATPADYILREEQLPFADTVDRLSEVMSRKVRDRQFRQRVIKIYKLRCSVSGSKLVDLDGAAEVQAAHIKSVQARGPDCSTNGIALCGTVHWAFDRGLISFTDEGSILVSGQINDPHFVRRYIPDDRQAEFPNFALRRPKPQYLQWHRENCFKP